MQKDLTVILKVKDLPRVMRLPGFFHQKKSPFQTRIVEYSGGLPKKTTEFITAFSIPPDGSPTKDHLGIDSGNPNPILNAIKSAGILIGKDGIIPGRLAILNVHGSIFILIKTMLRISLLRT